MTSAKEIPAIAASEGKPASMVDAEEFALWARADSA